MRPSTDSGLFSETVLSANSEKITERAFYMAGTGFAKKICRLL